MTAGEAKRTFPVARPLRFLRWWLGALIASGRLPAVLIAVGAAILLYGFLATDDYDVRDIVIVGSDYTAASEIADRADLLGDSIFRLDPTAAAERVADDPAIARVEVRLEFPARARILVTEREPVAIWRAAGESMLVDRTGFVIGPDDGRDLVTLRVPGAAPAIEQRVAVDVVQAATEIQVAFGDTPVVLSESDTLSVVLDDGRVVLFGFPERIGEKLQVLRSLLLEIGNDWTELDLSRPDRPAYR